VLAANEQEVEDLFAALKSAEECGALQWEVAKYGRFQGQNGPWHSKQPRQQASLRHDSLAPAHGQYGAQQGPWQQRGPARPRPEDEQLFAQFVQFKKWLGSQLGDHSFRGGGGGSGRRGEGVCWEFGEQGSCRWGDRCRFEHPR
jgi:hypothetical protein